ncbi:MAG: hypothetical protein IPK97_18945 [Ahniella sp.]|nr:hypothetical protein [Ahniella sp.]
MALFPTHLARLALMTAFLLLSAFPAHALIYRVGQAGDAACTHTFSGAINAANANPGKDFLLLSTNYGGIAASISDELEIAGGYASCSAPSPTAGLRHGIEGNGVNSVLFVDAGDGLTLRQVDISLGGNASLLAGGGIWKNGSGLVLIYDSVIRNNTAQLGGGIAVTGTGGMVLLYRGTVVRNNQATKGGGIYVDEAALRLDIADVLLHQNSALLGGDRQGGAIYATGTATRSAEVSTMSLTYDLFEPYPALSGVRIQQNSAHDGGGIYANGFTSVNLRETSLRDNTASRYGGAIYLFGAQLQMLRHPTISGWPIICQGAFGCNQITGNTAAFAGGAISLWNGSNAYVGQALISRNIGRDSIIDSFIQSVTSGLTNRLTMESVVLADNQCTASSGSCGTIRVSNTNNQSRVILRHVTMADNRMDGGSVSRAELQLGAESAATTQVSVYSSIIEPRVGNSMAAGNQPNIVLYDCVMAPGPFPPSATRSLQMGLPYRFVYRAGYDYRPADGDVAIDACDGSAMPGDTMLVAGADLEPFGSTDDPTVPNRLGSASTHDLGAFEMRPLLSNGFE